MQVGNLYEHAGHVEALFTTEAAAQEYAQRRSSERYRNSGTVMRCAMDSPAHRDWLNIYTDGQQTRLNTRVVRPLG